MARLAEHGTETDETLRRDAEWFERDHARHLSTEPESRMTITLVKEQAKALAAATGESLGRCLEAVSRQRANMNWHAYRARLLRPAPVIGLNDDDDHDRDFLHLIYPDEAKALQRLNLGEYRRDGVFRVGIPSVVLYRISSFERNWPKYLVEKRANYTRTIKILYKTDEVVLKENVADWLNESCSGAWRIRLLPHRMMLKQEAEFLVAAFEFKKQTDQELVLARFIRPTLDYLTGQALERIGPSHITLMLEIVSNKGSLRPLLNRGRPISTLRDLGLILGCDPYAPAILTEIGRAVLELLARRGFNLGYNHDIFSADSLLTRNDHLVDGSVAAAQLKYISKHIDRLPQAKNAALVHWRHNATPFDQE